MPELELKDILEMHDTGYNYSRTTRLQGSDDLVFAFVNQWDDITWDGSSLEYRGQFDVLGKAINQVINEINSNPVAIDFQPKDESREDAADFLEGLYLSDERENCSIEARANAVKEQIVTGFSAWLLYTDYETRRYGKSDQVIKRRPLYEAVNTVFCDPNAKAQDKSDADWWSILTPYSDKGYLKLRKELTGEDSEELGPSFSHPEHSYTFPWVTMGSTPIIYVCEFYHRELIKDSLITLQDPFGSSLAVLGSDAEGYVDDLEDERYQVVDEKEIERYEIKKYICSGAEILSVDVIPGDFLPVVPCYGERAIIEGEEYYEGVVRKAKDPQRLHNFNMSYLASIVSKSPREKAIYTDQQISGYEFMYEQSGSENNYPYLLQNHYDKDGNPLPIGPVSNSTAPQVPQALAALTQMTKESINDVANPGLPQDIADPDISGKAVYAIQNRLDINNYHYQHGFKHAQRRDAQIYASMASVIYDAPRKVALTAADGSRKTASVMESVFDEKTGNYRTINDITNMEWDVYADVGPSYSSKREQNIEKLQGLLQITPPGTPLHTALTYEIIRNIDGGGFEDLRKYADKQLLLSEIREPETPEEHMIVQKAKMAAQSQPNPQMILAQAEMEKAKADQMQQQREMMKDQHQAQIDKAEMSIDAYNAQTQREKVNVDAARYGYDMRLKQGKMMLDVQKEMFSPQMMRGRVGV